EEAAESTGTAVTWIAGLLLPVPWGRTATLLCRAALLCRVTRLLFLRRGKRAALGAALVRLGHSRASSQDLHACYACSGGEHEEGQSRRPRQLTRRAVRHVVTPRNF
ncbi:MAG TPA: hypothetical protein VFA63_04555, partial [Pseudonocardiaceae bacterium]|nr:hypothetical protein [Pseudonocardiaceae bacterium]